MRDLGIRIERIKEILKPAQYKQFIKWMRHQTIPILDDGTDGIYEWDLMRWIKELPIID